MLALILGVAFWKEYFNFQTSYKSTRMKKRTKSQSSLESARLCPCLLTLPVLVAITHGRFEQDIGHMIDRVPPCWPNPVWSNTWPRDTHWASCTYMGITHMDRVHLSHLLVQLMQCIVWNCSEKFSLRGCLQAIPHHKDSWSSFNVFTWSFQGYCLLSVIHRWWKRTQHFLKRTLALQPAAFQFWTPT